MQATAQQVLLYRNDGTRVKLHVSELDSIIWKADTWADPTGEPNRLPLKVLATIGEGDKAQRNGMHKLHMGTEDGTDEKTMLWQTDDKISLFQSSVSDNTNNLFTLSTGAETRQGSFSGTAAIGTSAIALYPYRQAMSLKGSSINDVILPTVQHATAGGYDPKAALMMGQTGNINEQNASELQIGFKNVCSYLVFTPSSDLSHIIVTSLNPNEALSGNVTLSLTDGIPTWTAKSGYTLNKVTLQGPLTADQTYYLAVLPGTLDKGFSIACYDMNGNVLTQQYNGSASFVRSKYHDCTPFTQGTGQGLVVDMGLKSGARYWSTHNIGASSPSDPGDYFAWGETTAVNSYGTNRTSDVELKDQCNWANYKYGDGQEHNTYSRTFVQKYGGSINSETFEQGGDDGKRELEGTDDAATTLWGSGWSMPTYADFNALITECQHEYIADYHGSGVNGIVFYHCDYNTDCGFNNDGKIDFVSVEGVQKEITHIFFPLGGHYENKTVNVNSTIGYYWSKDLVKTALSDNENNPHFVNAVALHLGISEGNAITEANYYPRFRGFNIRPVWNDNINTPN